MEINIINIEDRHQEKAFAIWKAWILRRIDFAQKRPRTSLSDVSVEVPGSFMRMVFVGEFQLFHLQITLGKRLYSRHI